MKRSWQMIVAFALGFTLDSFHHPGFHASACVLIALHPPFLVKPADPQEGADTNYMKNPRSMGVFAYIFYRVLTLIHHGWLFPAGSLAVREYLVFYHEDPAVYRDQLTVDTDHRTDLRRKQSFRTNTA